MKLNVYVCIFIDYIYIYIYIVYLYPFGGSILCINASFINYIYIYYIHIYYLYIHLYPFGGSILCINARVASSKIDDQLYLLPSFVREFCFFLVQNLMRFFLSDETICCPASSDISLVIYI